MFGSTSNKLNYQNQFGSTVSSFNEFSVPPQVFTVSISQDGNYMAFGGDDSKVYIYDMSTFGS